MIPSRLSSVDGGLTSTPSRTMKMCSALPSETDPRSVSRIASSKPLSTASRRASALLRYAAVGFARAGIALSAMRRHEEMQTLMDSLSMYLFSGKE